ELGLVHILPIEHQHVILRVHAQATETAIDPIVRERLVPGCVERVTRHRALRARRGGGHRYGGDCKNGAGADAGEDARLHGVSSAVCWCCYGAIMRPFRPLPQRDKKSPARGGASRLEGEAMRRFGPMSQ